MLLGRDAEAAQIDDLLEGIRAGESRALVVLGEPGIGKSALLDYAASRSHDMLVLRTRGTESESELAFSGLSDLLTPLVSHLPRIPPVQATALEGALALGTEVGADRFTVSLATLTLLSVAGEDEPVLVVVDDAHWLDAASLEALLFVAKRLGNEGRGASSADRPHTRTARLTRDSRRCQGESTGANRDSGAPDARPTNRSRAAPRAPACGRAARSGVSRPRRRVGT